MTSQANGRSVLRRRIVWQRHLGPEPYFSWLQQTVMERGQARLLELIDERVQQAKRERMTPIVSATR